MSKRSWRHGCQFTWKAFLHRQTEHISVCNAIFSYFLAEKILVLTQIAFLSQKNVVLPDCNFPIFSQQILQKSKQAVQKPLSRKSCQFTRNNSKCMSVSPRAPSNINDIDMIFKLSKTVNPISNARLRMNKRPRLNQVSVSIAERWLSS